MNLGQQIENKKFTGLFNTGLTDEQVYLFNVVLVVRKLSRIWRVCGA